METVETLSMVEICQDCGEDWLAALSRVPGYCRVCAVLKGLSKEP